VPRSTKPVSVEEYRTHVCSVAQRVQGALRTAEPHQMANLWTAWPKLASALADLDEEFDRPVIKRGLSQPTTQPTPPGTRATYRP
jgi:hypothetical protein